MRKTTREFIKDSDINMEKIEKRLTEIATSIKIVVLPPKGHH